MIRQIFTGFRVIPAREHPKATKDCTTAVPRRKKVGHGVFCLFLISQNLQTNQPREEFFALGILFSFSISRVPKTFY
jgi:hypothetical protein